MKRCLSLLVLLVIGAKLFANEQDSLTRILNTKLNDTTRINVLNRLATLLAEDDSLSAGKYTAKAMQMAESIGYTKGIIKGLYNLAYIEESNYKYQAASMHYQQGIQLAKASNLPALIGYGYQDYALNLKKQNLHRKSLQYNDSALAIYKSLGDSAKMAVLYANIGNNYKNLSLFDKAISYHLMALQYAQRHNSDKAIARAYNNIAQVYERIGNMEKALENYQAMEAPAIRSGDKKTLTVCYGNIGGAYQNLNQHEKSLTYLLKAKQLNELAGYRTELLMNLNNIANSQNALQQYKEALNTSNEAIRLGRTIDDDEGVGYALVSAGIAQSKMRNYSTSEKMLLDAQQIAVNIQSHPLRLLANEELAKLCQAQGQFEKGLKYWQQMTALKDSMYNAERHEQVASLQTQYEAELKDREIAEKTSAISQNQLQLERKNKLLTISLVSVVALVLMIALIIRNMKLRQERLRQKASLIQARAIAQLQEEKLRISRELHDNIGSQLTFINTSLQTLGRTSKHDALIKETQALTLNTIRELRNTVWLINKQEFTIDEFVIKLHEYTRTLVSNGLSLQLELNGDAQRTLKAITASHLFRVIQEGINNAMKHAAASLLKISINVTDVALHVRISDNGKGFEVGTQSAGYGLENLRIRLQEVKGGVEIVSKPGGGTSIDLSIPWR